MKLYKVCKILAKNIQLKKAKWLTPTRARKVEVLKTELNLADSCE